MKRIDSLDELVRRLDPIIVRRIAEAASGTVVAGGSGGSVALATFDDISGSLEWDRLDFTGSQLSDIASRDHGDLTGITANQHHAQSHVLATISALGPDHSVSGLTAGQVLQATGASAAKFAALSHGKLTDVTSDQHHPRLHNITSVNDHSIVAAQYVLVGATGANTLGLLTPSYNPGANPAILRTGATGDLTLATLAVEGNLDVTSGGDLTVGANILFVDASGANVGVNCAPDPQFDLDVAGNLRAQGWIVGKHAIQVKDATMIVHFDAGDGEKISTEGEPTGHMGQPALAVGDVLYGPGKFGGKSVQIMQSFTPVATYTFEADEDGFSIVSNTTSLAQSAAHAIHGDGSLRIEGAGAASGYVQSGYIAVLGSTDYSASVYWRSEYGVQLVITEYNSSNILINTRSAGQITPDGWERQTITWTTAAACTKVKFNFYHYNLPTSNYAYADAAQLIQSGYSLPFTDQASHASDYPYYAAPGVINPPKGTVMMWVKADAIDGTAQYAFTTGADGSSARAHIYINSSGNWTVAIGATTPTGTTAATAQEWTHIALTWDGATAVLYVNGAAAQSFGYTGMVQTVATYLRVGNNAASSASFNGWIDELAILKRAAPASEILAIYESDAPVFAETSVFSFRVGSSLVWGDDEGLWTRDTDGTAAFAVVGVDGKSWGGVTLDKGDLMIGNSADGYLQYDRSEGQISLVDTDLTLFYGNADRNKLKFVNGSTPMGEIFAYDYGGVDALQIWSFPESGASASELFIGTKDSLGAIQGYLLFLDNTINVQADLFVGGGDLTVYSQQILLPQSPLISYGTWANFRRLYSGGVPTDPTTTSFFKIDQNDSAGAMAALEVRQNDDSEELVFFNGNLGGSILTTSLGSYAGKIRISVGGLGGFYWLPFYN